MTTSRQQEGVGLSHLHGHGLHLGSVRPNDDDDLKWPGGPIGAEVQRLVGFLTVVGSIESVLHGMVYVVIIEAVAVLMLSGGRSNLHLGYRITKL